MIDADDPLIADLLAGTIELVREAGGFIAPTTRLVERAGQLSIESSAVAGEPLLRIPREAFVRVDRVEWSQDGDRIVIEQVPDDCGALEWEMLYLQVALHNACGKLAWMQRTHPSLDPRLPADLVDAVRAIVPSFRTPQMGAIDLLWANRCFRLPMEAGGPPERVLIPIVDLLNHDADGATGDWDAESFQVATAPAFGTLECALDYGMERDAMEMAVVYGFAGSSRAASSTSDYDLESLGRIIELASQPGARESAQPLHQAATLLALALDDPPLHARDSRGGVVDAPADDDLG
jgi:hypothetical protein